MSASLKSGSSRRRLRRAREGKARALQDLWSVGPAIERDLKSLGVHSVAQLARRSPERLYRHLERVTGRKQDPCVLDTFRAAVAQALDPNLPPEECVWWHYSGLRKTNTSQVTDSGWRKRRGSSELTDRLHDDEAAGSRGMSKGEA